MKRTKEKIKLWFVVLLCDIVAKLYGKTALDGFLHSVDFSLLSENVWNIDEKRVSGMRTARLKKYGFFGLCLFEKKEVA